MSIICTPIALSYFHQSDKMEAEVMMEITWKKEIQISAKCLMPLRGECNSKCHFVAEEAEDGIYREDL